jgi:hypothetical protein
LGFLPLATSTGHATPTQQVIEVSNSCATINTPFDLIIWGSNLPAGTLSDTAGLFAPRSESGDFTATIPNYRPTSPVGIDEIQLVVNPLFAPAARRDIRIENPANGDPPCPSTSPTTPPCLPIGQPVNVSVTGILPTFTDPPTVFAFTSWFLDYQGTNAGQQPFATSSVTAGAASATLPGPQATPGTHLVTALSQPQLPGVPPTPPFPIGDRDVYTTFPITVCPPPPGTTPTVPGTPGTTPTNPGTTPTTPGTSPTIPGTTTPTAPPGSATPVLTLSPAVAPTGQVVMVTGNGFPDNTPVVVQWSPGVGSVATNSGPLGQFTTQLLIMPHDQLGNRQAVAVGFPTAVAPMLVVPSAIEPGGSNVAILFHN